MNKIKKHEKQYHELHCVKLAAARGVLGNGHSIDNFLRIYGINPSLYQKPEPAKTENQVFIDSNPGLLKPWEPKY